MQQKSRQDCKPLPTPEMSQTALLTLLTLVSAVSLIAAQENACCAARTTVTARGDATAQVKQNITAVSVSVDVGGPTAFGVQAAISDALTVVADFLLAQGAAVANVETFGSRLSPQYDYNFDENRGSSSRTFREYTATGRISFDLIDVASEVLDGVTGLQSVTVSSITKREAEDEMAEAKLVALEEAIASARVKAERMAAALGKTLGDPISVSDSSREVIYPGASASEARLAASSSDGGGGGGGGGPPGVRTLYADAVVVYAFV